MRCSKLLLPVIGLGVFVVSLPGCMRPIVAR